MRKGGGGEWGKGSRWRKLNALHHEIFGIDSESQSLTKTKYKMKEIMYKENIKQSHIHTQNIADLHQICLF